MNPAATPASGEDEGFEEEHGHEVHLRAAEGFHQGEVAAAFEDGGGEGGEDADGDGEGDEKDGSVHEGVGAVDDAGFAFDELADGLDLNFGELLLELRDGGFDSASLRPGLGAR